MSTVPVPSYEVSLRELENSLNELVAGESSDPLAYRHRLMELVGAAWRATAEGKPEYIHQLLEQMGRVRRIIDDYFTQEPDPLVMAVIEVRDTIRVLQTAKRVLARVALEHRILGPDEAAILCALDAAGRYVEREEVHAQIQGKSSLSLGQVGAKLVEFFHCGYLLRYQANKNDKFVSFYALAPRGKTVLSNQPS